MKRFIQVLFVVIASFFIMAVASATEMTNVKSVDELKSITEKPTIVYVYATWCGFCKRFNPIFDKIDKEGKVVMLKANYQTHPWLEKYLGVRGFPSYYLIQNGKVLRKDSGLPSESQFRSFITGAKPRVVAPKKQKIQEASYDEEDDYDYSDDEEDY